jgi:dihydropteroate synthase
MAEPHLWKVRSRVSLRKCSKRKRGGRLSRPLSELRSLGQPGAAVRTYCPAIACDRFWSDHGRCPEEWRSLPPIGDPVLMVKRDLRQWAEAATLAGIKRDRLVLDPGFGFGKRFEENYPLLAHFAELQQMGFPLLAGVSRKSFIGRTLARDGKDAEVAERLSGTLAAETGLILKGAHIIRTHDVRFAVDAARVADAIVASGG